MQINCRKSQTKIGIYKLVCWKLETAQVPRKQHHMNIFHSGLLEGGFFFCHKEHKLTISINTLPSACFDIPCQMPYLYGFLCNQHLPPCAQLTRIEPESGINHYLLLKMHHRCPSLSAGWPALQAKGWHVLERPAKQHTGSVSQV